jgi:hypothetical protein
MTVLAAPPESVLLIDRAAVDAAVARAPSLHGPRPWRLEADGPGVALRTDLRRRLPATDPEARSLRLSCGVGLLTVRLAVAAQGLRPVVGLLPDPTRPGLVGTVHPAGGAEPRPDEAALHAALPHRCAPDAPGAGRPVTAADRLLLRRAAEVEGAWLHAVDRPDERHRVGELLRRAHRHQWVDPGVRAERDRTGPRARAATRAAALRAGSDPAALLLVLGTRHDGPVAQVRAGQALQRVLLTATVLGLTSTVLPAPTEVRATREELTRLYGPGLHPQVVLRVGHPGT